MYLCKQIMCLMQIWHRKNGTYFLPGSEIKSNSMTRTEYLEVRSELQKSFALSGHIYGACAILRMLSS